MSTARRQGTVTHEVGHSLGLKHRATRYKMLYNTNEEQRATTPDSIDFSNIAILYGARGTSANQKVAPNDQETTETIID